MKRFISFLVALLLCTAALWAQHKRPYMDFKELKYNFGTITQKAPVKHVFTFINSGAQPIIINQVVSSCGCTTPYWPRKPILPGQKGQITVVYDPRNRPGQFHKVVTIYSNAKNSPVQLVITGKVLEKTNPIDEEYPYDFGFGLRFPTFYINFGPLYTDQVRTKTIKIYNNSSATVNIVPATKRLPQYLKVKVSPTHIPPKHTATITITYDASKVHDWDYVRTIVFFNINGKFYYKRWLDISAIIKERFTQAQKQHPPKIHFNSTEYNFGTITQGTIVKHTFDFTNTGTSGLIIRKVRTSCGCTTTFYTHDTIPPGGHGQIKVRFDSHHKLGPQIKIITVITNSPDPESNKVLLRLTGTVIKPKK